MRYLAAFLLATTFAGAGAANTGALFVATNPALPDGTPQPNAIVMYNRADNGTLTMTPGSPFPTRGGGSGPAMVAPADPLGSQGSLAVSKDNKFLFAVNAGSGQVSVFRIAKTGLSFIETASTGDAYGYPTSLTVHDKVLYVLNAAEGFFSGFTFDDMGHLTPLVGSTCSLASQPNEPSSWPYTYGGWRITPTEVFAMPGQIAFTPDGNKLVIVRKEGFLVESVVSQGSFQTQWTGRIDVYVLKNGTPVSCSNPASYLYSRGPTAGSMPFALAFTEKGYLLVTEVLGNASTGGSPFGASTMSSFQINSDGSLKLPPLSGSVPSTTSAMCWVVRYGKYAYAGNQLSGSISAYQVLDSGTPNLVHLGDVATGAAPSDMAITADGKYLYALTSGTTPYPSIQGFTVGKDTGSLTPFGAAGFPVPGSPLAGQAGMALAEF